MKAEIKQLIEARNRMESARRAMEDATLAYRQKARNFANEVIGYDAVYSNHIAVFNEVAYFIEIDHNWGEFDDLANAVHLSAAINHGDLSARNPK